MNFRLYLKTDLIKAGIKYDYWRHGGVPPAGEGWEQSPSGAWRRPVGAGKVKQLVEGKKPEKKVKEVGLTGRLKDKTTSGSFSTNIADYPKDSKAIDHYKIAQQHSNDGYAEGSAGHKKIARERAKGFDDKQHQELADQLKKEGMAEEAAWHEKQLKKPSINTEQEPSKLPTSDFENAKVANHQKVAEEIKEKLSTKADKTSTSVVNAVESHTDLKTVPTDEQAKELKELKAMAQDSEETEPQQQPTKSESNRGRGVGTNMARRFEQGRAAGERTGQAAEGPYSAGAIGAQAITYASQGAVHTGHALLKDSPKKEEKTKGGEVKQSSMNKSLYLDLNKAVTPPNVGTITETESRARIKHESSYAKRPVGVASGEEHEPDDPEVGHQWKHSDEDSVEHEVDEKLKVKKSLDFLQSLNTGMRRRLNMCTPTNLEREFLLTQLGFKESDIVKGLAEITGKNRHKFNEWAQNRLNKSVLSLRGWYE